MEHRLKFVTYLQVIGIILVVLGHSFHEYPDSDHGTEMLLYRMMYSFRMPVFMFTSGFLLVFTTSHRPRGWGEFAVGKLKRLMIPFLTLTLVTFVPRSFMSGMADDTVELSFMGLIKAIVMSDHLVIPYFWFLHSSFTLLLMVYGVICLMCARKLDPKLVYSGLVAAILAINFLPLEISSLFSLNMTVWLGIYFILGCVYAQWREEIDIRICWHSPMVFLVSCLLWTITFFVRDAIGTWCYILCSCFGICMIISLAKMLEYYHIGVLDHLQGANYIIFLLSWYFNVLTQQVLSHFVALPWWVHTILSLTTGIYLPWLYYRYMLRHPSTRFTRISAFLLGQNIK